MVEKTSASVDETIELGRQLSACLRPDDVVLLSGDLGAGKTQFSKGVAAGLGVSADVTSPTFNILIEYEGSSLMLYHFDLYRLEDAEELEDIDFYGMLESGGVSLVEWGDKFPDAMPDEYLDVRIAVDGDGVRHLTATGRGDAGQRLEEAFAQRG